MQTFVVRLYRPEVPSPALRGVVEEVVTGSSATFHDAEELVRILEDCMHGEETQQRGTHAQ
jgi:hypothetical protein